MMKLFAAFVFIAMMSVSSPASASCIRYIGDRLEAGYRYVVFENDCLEQQLVRACVVDREGRRVTIGVSVPAGAATLANIGYQTPSQSFEWSSVSFSKTSTLECGHLS